ncbi:STAS domain-containing protein [Streptomyces sp. NPDC058646]|uniref:STAS domain-containing protein n=1 Tax=Streptomyces sp. NPDC058646 TaxID=3346574 RepID=UPI00364D7117
MEEHESAAARIQMTRSQQGTVVRVVGEMDMDRARQFRTALDEALADHPATIVVDLTALTFCDSSGLNVLLGARQAAVDLGCQLRLAGPNPQVVRLLEMTGADQLFPVSPPAAA